MNQLFISVLKMSFTASYVILFVIVIRLFLKKAPKVISYALWVVVAFRLMLPFSFESAFSFMPRDMDSILISDNIQQSSQVNNEAGMTDIFLNNSSVVSNVNGNANQLQIMIEAGSWIWFAGILILLSYSMISSLNLSRKLKSARFIKNHIYDSNFAHKF